MLAQVSIQSPFTKAPTVTSGPQRSQLHSMALQQREMFAVRHRPFSPTADASTRTLAAVKRLNPAGMEQAGASSTFLNLPPTYFNILYVHPQFGALTPWAATASPLPPINQARQPVPPTDRMASRISWGLPAKEWGTGLEPGERAIHLGHTLKGRMLERDMRFNASPNRHCSPAPPLPRSPRKEVVHPSTHPMLRLPPHTTLEKQRRTAMFGAHPPADGWDGEKKNKMLSSLTRGVSP